MTESEKHDAGLPWVSRDYGLLTPTGRYFLDAKIWRMADGREVGTNGNRLVGIVANFMGANGLGKSRPTAVAAGSDDCDSIS